VDTGQVRSILGIHFARLHPNALPVAASDPNQLVESWSFVEGLRTVAALKGETALREAAADYVALWARTFRTLVRQLRGRPERAISLFAEEFYPFLRGDRLAARVESAQPGRARLLLLADLPEGYLAGLLEAFVRLSGARATVTTLRGGRFDVAYRIAPVDRVARIAQQMAVLRIPLVLAAALACLLGVAMAARDSAADLPWTGVAAVLVGGVAAQLGANAWHDLRHPHPAGPLRLLAPSRRQSLWQARAGYTVATLCGLYLASKAPVVLAFAAAGLVVSFLFGHFRSRGWGPVLAGFTYGPLMVGGAYHAFHPVTSDLAVLATNFLPAAALGCSAAALLHLDDLADKPLDEAGGQRTLAVRLPRTPQALVLDALAGAAWIATLATLALPSPAALLSWPVLLVGAALLVWLAAVSAIVHRSLDDPAGLGPARVGILGFHAAVAAVLAVTAHLGWGSSLVGLVLATGLLLALGAVNRSRRYHRLNQTGTPA
jgi:1,4-dihydroxy-2-naphthoate octaprenyltransferase